MSSMNDDKLSMNDHEPSMSDAPLDLETIRTELSAARGKQ